MKVFAVSFATTLSVFSFGLHAASAACREVTCMSSCGTQQEVTNACKTELKCAEKACIPSSFVANCSNFNTQCLASCTGEEDADCSNVVCPTGMKYCKVSIFVTDPCASGGSGTCQAPVSGSCPNGGSNLGTSATCLANTDGKSLCCKSGGSGSGSTTAKCDTTKFKEYAGVCFPLNTGLSETSVAGIVVNLMKWMLYLFGFLAIIAFVISGIQYLTAAGSMNMIETAKRNMNYSIIGVIVALSGVVILTAIDSLLRATAWGG